MTLTTMLNVAFQNIYTIYIGKVFSPYYLGLYNRAESLRNLPIKTLMNVLRKVLIPLFSKIEEEERLKQAYSKTTSAMLFLLSPLLVFIIFQAENLVVLMLTDKWLGAVPYLKILCFGGFLHPLSEYNKSLLVVKGKSRLILRLEIYKKLIMAMIFIASTYWGIRGIAIGQVFNSLLVFLIGSLYTKKIIGYSVREQLLDIAPSVILSVVCASIAQIIYFQITNIEVLCSNVCLELVFFTGTFLLSYLIIAKSLRLYAYKTIEELIRTV